MVYARAQDTPLGKRPGFVQAAVRSHHLLSPTKDNVPFTAPTKLLGLPQSPMVRSTSPPCPPAAHPAACS
jgi:hypothetical protein